MLVIGMVGIAASLLAIQFKTIKPEYSMYISLGGCVLIIFYSIKGIESIATLMNRVMALETIGSGYMKILFKIVGIAFVAEISSDISGDCGFQALAKQIQVFGKLSILVVSLPVYTEIITLIGDLLS
jgi:stage III sporulation protein AD